jgi:predicted permease
MRWLQGWLGRSDRDLLEEIQLHIDTETQCNIERGMSPTVARQAAEKKFGNTAVLRESVREARPLFWLDTLVRDFRHALRQARRNPLLSIVLLVVLTFGIGFCSTVFTVLDAEVLSPKVDKSPEAFVKIVTAHARGGAATFEPGPSSLRDYLAFQESATGIATLAGYRRIAASLDDENAPPVGVLLVTCNFFSVFGPDVPKLGRLLGTQECGGSGSDSVVVLSEEVWNDRFSRDPEIIGRTIHVNQQPLTVAGIVPARFAGRRSRDIQLWVPYTMQPSLASGSRGDTFRNYLRDTDTPWLEIEGLLNPNYGIQELQAVLQVVANRRDQQASPRVTRLFVTNGSVFSDPYRRSRIYLPTVIVLGALALVLLVVCTNASLLLLARAASRQREIAIRLSLGASRTRLLRMLLSESLLLAALAACFSAWIAGWAPDALRTAITGEPANFTLRPDWTSYGFLMATAAAAGVLAGLSPALESLRTDLGESLKSSTGIVTVAASRINARTALVFLQVLLCTVVLVLVGTMSLANLTLRADSGFDAAGILSAQVPKSASSMGAHSISAQRMLASRLSATPGIRSVSFVADVVQSDLEGVTRYDAPSHSPIYTTVRLVAPGYLETIGLPPIMGRSFTESDWTGNSRSMAVASEGLVRSLWPGQSPVGKLLRDSSGAVHEIVSAVRDLPRNYFNGTATQLYILDAQAACKGEMVVRFNGDAGPAIATVRTALRELRSDLMLNPNSLEEQAQKADSKFRSLVNLVWGIGVITVLLAIIGLYGTVSFSMDQRMKEMGIRSALGASVPDLLWLAVQSSMRPVAVGMVAGIPVALGATAAFSRVLGGSAAGFDGFSVIVYALVLAFLAASSFFAILPSAIRGATADAVTTLRVE